ncbi:Rv3235 family protein [Spirillospora sp. NPDC047279]|uniref:Rv3235 family protein n=1 Tax=Spirillospora sp. NPDC047279 TaxID=3155478 RepID=UPI0033ED917B
MAMRHPRSRPFPLTTTGYAVDGSLALRPETLRAMSGTQEPPGIRDMAEATVRLVAEVLAGTLPPRQLARRALPEVCLALAAHQGRLETAERIVPPRILTSWLQRPAPNAAEAGAVAVIHGRVQGIALRLEHRRGRWRCTTVQTTLDHGGRPRVHTFG